MDTLKMGSHIHTENITALIGYCFAIFKAHKSLCRQYFIGGWYRFLLWSKDMQLGMDVLVALRLNGCLSLYTGPVMSQ